MRITLLFCATLALTASTASAQTFYSGPWQPRPSIGVAVGAPGLLTRNGDATVMRSATLEIPFVDSGRIRIEAARTTLPMIPQGAPDGSMPVDVAHTRRLTISVAGLRSPGARVTAYVGTGVGFYQTTFDHAPKLPVRMGMHLHGGAELDLDGLSIDAELGFHRFRDDRWFQRKVVTGEAVIRVKMAL